jgi:hypothetical protein
MGTDNEGLIFVVTYDADARRPVHLRNVIHKLALKLGMAYIVDSAVETLFVQHRHTAPSGAQMAVIVRSVKKIDNTICL